MYLYNISKEIKADHASEDTIRKALLYFSVYNTIGLSNPTLGDSLNDFYPDKVATMTPPSYIMNFTHTENFQKVEQILSIRTLQAYGDTTFYQLKSFWKKAFNLELTFEKEFIPLKKEDYAEKLKNIIMSYHKSEKSASNEDVVLP
jgi:hypothetical protein